MIRRRGGVFAFAVSLAILLLALFPGPAKGQQTLYATAIQFPGPDQLLTINPVTGAGTIVGPIGGPAGPYMGSFGLAFRGAQLFVWDEQALLIRQIDPVTANIVQSINIGPNPGGEGDICFRSDGIGFLSPITMPGPRLISFDITVPNSTVVNPLAVPVDGLAFNGAGVLYGLSQSGNQLYTIDPATAAMTLVGNTGLPPGGIIYLGGLAFDASGKLFVVVSTNGGASFLYSVNPATAALNLIGNIGVNSVTGIAFTPPPPPPPPPAVLPPSIIPPVGSEGSFAGSQDPQSGAEGSFGQGDHVAANAGSPVLAGPLLDAPDVLVSPGFACSPPAGSRLRVFNISGKIEAAGSKVAASGDGILGFAVLAGLGLAVAVVLAKTTLALSGSSAGQK